MITNELKLDVGDIKEKWPIAVESNFYWMVFRKWWDHFNLGGNGIAIGHRGDCSDLFKTEIRLLYPGITAIQTADLEEADIRWDICQPKYIHSFDFIICQAVLEHVKDPIGAVLNMGRALNTGGLLYIHTHGPKKRAHRHPIDCWRFLPDAFTVMAEIAQLEIVDSVYGPENHFIVYGRKPWRKITKESIIAT